MAVFLLMCCAFGVYFIDNILSACQTGAVKLTVPLKRIHQQTVQTTDGKTLTGLTEMTAAQKSLFAALELALPTPENLTQPVL